MPKIQVLPETIANKIAAGEVIERPASVVKELLENAIDAGATQITVEIRDAGKKLIRVVDNGSGMSKEDAALAFARHATSKLVNEEDLFAIRTLGFRGEALPSIASISKVELITRTQDSISGTRIQMDGGKLIDVTETGAPVGTSFSVYQLFFNTPARLKFLKGDTTENNHITSAINHLALAYPAIGFRLLMDGRETLRFSPAAELRDRVVDILGKETDRELLSLGYTPGEGLEMSGFIARPALTRIKWSYFQTFVNGRFVISRLLNGAVQEGYHGFLMTGRFPVGILFLQIDPRLVDVNVHPAKREVRFRHEADIRQAVIEAVKQSLRRQSVIPEIQTSFVEPIEHLKEPLLHQETPVNKGISSASGFSKPAMATGYSQPKPYQGGKYPSATPQPAVKRDYRRPDFNRMIQEALSHRKTTPAVTETAIIPENSPAQGLPGFVEPAAPQDFTPPKRKRPLCAAEVETEDSGATTAAETPLFQDKLPFLEPIAQLDETYIICRSGSDLLILDQHAAHERILFDKLLPKMENQAPLVQPLLIPEVIELSARESALLEEYQEELKSMGMEIESVGKNSFAIRSLPSLIDRADPRELLRDLLDSFGSLSGALPTDEIRYQMAAVMSCRAAIKAGDYQNELEWKTLVKQLGETSHPYTCPHGRPTLIRLSKAELEKRFKRTGA
jgi:DNA mismatch repair protein MutL